MPRSQGFQSDFKLFFGRGLAILLPTIVTLWIIYQAFMFLLTNVAEPINAGLRMTTVWVLPLVLDKKNQPDWFLVTDQQIAAQLTQSGDLPEDPAERMAAVEKSRDAMTRTLRRERLAEFWKAKWYLQFVGLLLAILLIYLAGLLLGNFFGRQIYHRVERLIAAVPGFKQVYPHVKQVVELILGEKAMAFSTVVLVEYPSKDIWTLGFLTGDSLQAVDDAAGATAVSVFIPTSPTPFTGFTINLARDRVRVVDIPVDQALRFVLTAGILAPERNEQQGIVARPLEEGTVAVVPARRVLKDDEEPVEPCEEEAVE